LLDLSFNDFRPAEIYFLNNPYHELFVAIALRIINVIDFFVDIVRYDVNKNYRKLNLPNQGPVTSSASDGP
jgi:hypothetical protein